MIVEGVTHQWH